MPARPPFRVEVEPYLEEVVVRAHGVLDADAAAQLEACLRSLREIGLQRLRIAHAGAGVGPAPEMAHARRRAPSRR